MLFLMFPLALARSRPEAKLIRNFTGSGRTNIKKEVRFISCESVFYSVLLKFPQTCLRKVSRPYFFERKTWLCSWCISHDILCAYGWIVSDTIMDAITLGQNGPCHLLLFSRAKSLLFTASLTANQAACIEEQPLFCRTYYEYLGTKRNAIRLPVLVIGPKPKRWYRFEMWSYSVSRQWKIRAITNVTLHIRPVHSLAIVGENVLVETTLIKFTPHAFTIHTRLIFI